MESGVVVGGTGGGSGTCNDVDSSGNPWDTMTVAVTTGGDGVALSSSSTTFFIRMMKFRFAPWLV